MQKIVHMCGRTYTFVYVCLFYHFKNVYTSFVPEAAAPQTTPQINGGQVTGFVS